MNAGEEEAINMLLCRSALIELQRHLAPRPPPLLRQNSGPVLLRPSQKGAECDHLAQTVQSPGGPAGSVWLLAEPVIFSIW